MTIRSFRVLVEGAGPFPLDMLRYDGCYPETSADVAAISLRHDECRREDWLAHRVVSLITHSQTGIQGAVTRERWASFGWKVNSITPASR